MYFDIVNNQILLCLGKWNSWR